MELLVFCHLSVAYKVPKKVFDKVQEYDKEHHKDYSEEGIKYIEWIKQTYKPIDVGYFLTGDLQ